MFIFRKVVLQNLVSIHLVAEEGIHLNLSILKDRLVVSCPSWDLVDISYNLQHVQFFF